MFMTMKSVMINISEAKTNLSEYARRVKRGERIILCDRNKPFAEIRPLRLTAEGRRPFGLASGKIALPNDFNEEDPEIEALFGASGDKQ
jgi:antitoxin (DNA-binding transcriptional repressor) of toxin-antitoxin stability system